MCVPKHVCKGVLHPSKEDCDPNSIDHAVVIVGYGVESKYLFVNLTRINQMLSRYQCCQVSQMFPHIGTTNFPA